MVTKKNDGKKPSAKGIAKAMIDKTPPKPKKPYSLEIRGHEAEVKWMPADQLAALKPHEACVAFPPLDDEAMETLTISLATGYDEGQPIIVWKETGELVEGKHRRDIMSDLGYEAPVAIVPFADKDEVVKFVVGSNLGRRHMTSAGARKSLREKLYKLGMKVTEIAKATGESKQTVSASLADTRRAEKNERNATVQAELAMGATPQEAAKKAGTSAATARREQAHPTPPKPTKAAAKAAKTPPAPPASSKPMPASTPSVKLDPKCEEVFKEQPHNARVFSKLVTAVNSPVAYIEQLPLAKAVYAAMGVNERHDKALGEKAVHKLVAELREGGSKATPPAATAPAGSNVVTLPVAPRPQATAGWDIIPPLSMCITKAKAMTKLNPAEGSKVRKIAPKTLSDLLKLAFEVYDEVSNGGYIFAMNTVTMLIAASYAEHPAQTPENRLKWIMGEITAGTGAAEPKAPAPAPEKPATAPQKPATPPQEPAKAEAPAKAEGKPAKAAAKPAKKGPKK